MTIIIPQSLAKYKVGRGDSEEAFVKQFLYDGGYHSCPAALLITGTFHYNVDKRGALVILFGLPKGDRVSDRLISFFCGI